MLSYSGAARNRPQSMPSNRLLIRLPPEDLRRLEPHLEPVTLPPRKILVEPDQPLRRIYLIETGVTALVTVFEDGTTVEMATIGREGLIGVDTLLGGDTGLGSYVVQAEGAALAVEVSRFQAALRESPALATACEAYAQAFFSQILQNVACSALHTVERRCARRLLMSDDRSDGDTFALTQEALAEVLGVRRATVTLIDRALQEAGLIAYHRGAVTVRDRPGLEAAACECYRLVRDCYEDLLPRSLA
jgi:CRP-like cAMP-binding protein